MEKTLGLTQNFIDGIIYDLDTVRVLKNYSRCKETIPIVQNIFQSIDSFRDHIDDNTPRLKKIFPPDSWSEIRKKFDQSQHQGPESIDYAEFLTAFQCAIFQSVAELKTITKTHQQRTAEKWAKVGSIGIIGICLAVLVIISISFRSYGLSAEFFEGTNFERLLFSTQQKTIHFSQHFVIGPGLPSENFSARWQGTLLVPEDGEYEFLVVVDDGARLYLDDETLIDGWSDHDNSRLEKKIVLEKGPHKIRLEYFNHWGKSALSLLWKKPRDSRMHVIPAWYFRWKSK